MFTNLIASATPSKGLPAVKEHVNRATARSRRHRRRHERAGRYMAAA